MNKKYKTLVISSILALSSAFTSADTITIRADSWFPMNGEPGSATPGFMIELAQKAFSKAGHTVDYRLMPWERAVDEVRKGSFDCVVGAYKEDAPDFVFPTENWGMDATKFFKKAGNAWSYSGIASLDSEKIGIISGYAYDDAFDEYAKGKSNVQSVKGDDALDKNIKKLMAGRISITVESPLVMNAKLKELGMQGQIVPAGDLGDASEMFIACSPAKPGSKALVELVDSETKALRASGELSNIMAKYGLSDWK